MNFFQFLITKQFFKNLAIGLVSIAVLLFLLFMWLDKYTLHGQVITVPDFSNLKTTELDEFIKDKHLRYEIIDSVYDAKKPAGVVLRQDPEINSEVKDNRIIYLYITSDSPPMVAMPNLKDKSLRQALAILESYGLRMKKLDYKADLCANCVLKQSYKGKEVAPGTMLQKGSFVDLLVGQGLSDEPVGVPNVIGMSRDEAVSRLAEVGLSEDVPIYDNIKDSTKAKVYRQVPPASDKNLVKMGSSVRLYLSADPEKINIKSDSIITSP